MEKEKYNLKWNEFEKKFCQSVRNIRLDEDFFDVTLSVGSKHLKAHKLVLSSCSSFFKTVLKENPHQHPLLYLRNIDFIDLKAVLDFMYFGEVNIEQDHLTSFLKITEELQIHGLSGTEHSQENREVSRKRIRPTELNQMKRSKPSFDVEQDTCRVRSNEHPSVLRPAAAVLSESQPELAVKQEVDETYRSENLPEHQVPPTSQSDQISDSNSQMYPEEYSYSDSNVPYDPIISDVASLANSTNSEKTEKNDISVLVFNQQIMLQNLNQIKKELREVRVQMQESHRSPPVEIREVSSQLETCRTLEEIQKLEEKLSDPVFRSALVKRLEYHNTSKERTSCYRVMESIATYGVWSFFSFLGRTPGKLSLKKDLKNVYHVIQAAVTSRHPKTTHAQMKDSLSVFLKNSPQRHRDQMTAVDHVDPLASENNDC